MKILVTGGAGFIGSNFIIRNALKSNELTVVDKLTYAGRFENIRSIVDKGGADFYQYDICDADCINSVVAHSQPEVVVHFAAESHVSRSVVDPASFCRTNVIGTQTLLEAVRQHSPKTRFIHISTDEVFGQLSEWEKPWSDYSPINPRSPYAASKASAELIARSYFTTYGLDVIVVRPSNCFGPYQFPEKMIPRSVTNLLEGKNIQLMGQGLQMRDWLYVDDLCDYIMIIAKSGTSGECYNIPGGSILRNRDVVSSILDVMKLDWSRVTEIPHRLAHDFKYHVDGTNIKELHEKSPYKVPRASFLQRLESTVDWYETNQSWWKKLKEEGEKGNEGADSGRRNR